jgi:hypothetical protein
VREKNAKMLCKACALPWNDQCGHRSSQDRTCETTDTEIEEGEVIAGFLHMREDDFLKVQLQQGGAPVGELIAFDDAVALLESEDANKDTYLRMPLPDREGRQWCSFRGDDWSNERWIVIRQRHLKHAP